MRRILDGVIAAHLIIGSAIEGPQVDVFELRSFRLDAKCNPDESTIVRRRVRPPITSNIDFDCAVFEVAFREDRKHRPVGVSTLRQWNKMQSLASTIG
jgi:hypothetical protein